jgi:CheY-like chemotaxis protein/nitrogen-specific signal transduction histidine kinase
VGLADVFARSGSAVYAFYRNQLSKKLEHAENRRLQELDVFKNRFFTNITHEFRTPLTVIMGMSEQVLSDGVAQNHPVTIARPVSLIKRSGENLLRLINQILDLAKLESNALKINYLQGDALPYLRYITESLQSFANAQNVMLRVESTEAEIVMDYDPERLLQIVHNLLSNAIKFTPSGGRVTLRADLTTYEKLSNLQLIVTDTGAGIATEDLPNIFDRFYQANNLEKAKAGGTGIGLSLTKELVKAMGGDISVESEVGKGTVFTVRLPITNRSEKRDVRSENIDIGETETVLKSEAVPSTDSHRLTLSPSHSLPSHPLTSHGSLLIIEDNPDVVEYLVACLGEHYRLDFAYNGRSGIEKALEIVPDLIVSDVMMPEKDGFEVCETLKNDERTSHIPIVLLTAKADAASRIAGLRRGADAYLSKPFHKEELLAQLQVLAEKQRRIVAWLSKKAQNGTPASKSPKPLPKRMFWWKTLLFKRYGMSWPNTTPTKSFGLPQLCQQDRHEPLPVVPQDDGTDRHFALRFYTLLPAERSQNACWKPPT